MLRQDSVCACDEHAYKSEANLSLWVLGLEDCVFCRIVEDVTNASVLYSDERVLAFMDHQPVNPGHVLVIPKGHASRLAELDGETGAWLFRVAMRVAEGLRLSGLKCEGVNLHLADGEAAGQEVLHVHLHVIPRFRGDGFGIRFGRHYGFRPDRSELETTASRIKQAMP
jgi:histidine triad (HIT) family protein